MVSVFGIGNPLMDYVASGDFELLKRLNVTPGTMNLITHEQRMLLLEDLTDYRMIPGG